MMKDKILGFLLGIIVVFSIAATTDTITVFKPAKAIQTKADWFKLSSSAIDYIQKNTSEGWQVKLVESNGDAEYLVVLEKY